MLKVTLFHSPVLNKTRIRLPGSKSESNRALLIRALGGFNNPIINLSEARDTTTMEWLLQSQDKELNVIDAGTTMRFLTAYLAFTDDQRILTGSDRMLERPIGILVNALRTIGADIQYLGKENFPPLLLKPFAGQKSSTIDVRGDMSSQYLSALLMVAPTLPHGLAIRIEGELVSRPYVEMTLSVMKEYGVVSKWVGNQLEILPQKYIPTHFEIESDWSAASYWYSLIGLAHQGEIELLGLRKNSYQGDQRIATIMADLGVATEYRPESVLISKLGNPRALKADFKACPDLAQTVAVTCAGLGLELELIGIENLAIKETDRISALTNELAKLGVQLTAFQPDRWKLSGSCHFPVEESLEIETYLDHRMAMAFACLAPMGELTIRDPNVVNKSYPAFWKHLASAGIRMEFVHD